MGQRFGPVAGLPLGLSVAPDGNLRPLIPRWKKHPHTKSEKSEESLAPLRIGHLGRTSRRDTNETVKPGGDDQ